jgi:hypothetical protein
MKIFSRIRRLLHRPYAGATAAENKAPSPADPMDHPDIRRMSLRELADLPFNRTCCADCR